MRYTQDEPPFLSQEEASVTVEKCSLSLLVMVKIIGTEKGRAEKAPEKKEIAIYSSFSRDFSVLLIY